MFARTNLLAVAVLAAPAVAQTSLDKTLTPYLEKHELPAIAAAVVKEGKVVAAGAVGTRKVGADLPVTVNDRFHLGSDTKAMTALLAGMLVEEGKLKWTSTLPDVFPALTEGMDKKLKAVTLEQFLSHTSGVPADDAALMAAIDKATLADGNLDEQRYSLVKEWSTKPVGPPGAFAYANMNYVFAGAMIERLAGKTWEELVTERVFAPLELKTAGVGCQASLGRVDAPLGHTLVDGKRKAFLAGPNGDNPLVLGPAGTGHMSVLDFAKWAGWVSGGVNRGPKLVKPETLTKLLTPVVTFPPKKDAPPGTPSGGGYALGWGEMAVEWASNPLIHHGGSNGKNLAHIWIDRKRDLAMVVLTNMSGKKADEGLKAIARELYETHAGPAKPGK